MPSREVPLRKITVTPTITGAYTSGDCLGGLLTFADASVIGGGTGEIVHILITSKIAWVSMDLVLYDSAPTVPADNAAAALNTADIAKVVGVWSISTGTAIGTPAIGIAQATHVGYQTKGGTALYGQLITRGTPTYTAGDLSVSLTVEPEIG